MEISLGAGKCFRSEGSRLRWERAGSDGRYRIYRYLLIEFFVLSTKQLFRASFAWALKSFPWELWDKKFE